MLKQFWLIARYGLAGLINTGVGLAVILLLDPLLGVAPALANGAGYVAGIAVGFALNRYFVFRSGSHLPGRGPRYALAVAASFLLNQSVLWVVGRMLSAGAVHHLIAQLAAIGAYSIALFVLCQAWVFKAEPQVRAT